MRILITGFEPFGGRSTNPTAQLIDDLLDGHITCPPGTVTEGLLLPVTFADAFEVLQKRSEEFRPDVVLALGLAANRQAVELERVAINCLDADIPDNKGQRPVDELINPRGESAYFSSLPLRNMESALSAFGIPARISNTAGTYVCNYLFYRLMETHQGKLCGFVHFPSHEVLSHALQRKALELMVEAVCSSVARP